MPCRQAWVTLVVAVTGFRPDKKAIGHRHKPDTAIWTSGSFRFRFHSHPLSFRAVGTGFARNFWFLISTVKRKNPPMFGDLDLPNIGGFLTRNAVGEAASHPTGDSGQSHYPAKSLSCSFHQARVACPHTPSLYAVRPSCKADWKASAKVFRSEIVRYVSPVQQDSTLSCWTRFLGDWASRFFRDIVWSLLAASVATSWLHEGVKRKLKAELKT
jgi:hypothetical protein